MKRKKPKRKPGAAGPALPAHTDWRTTDADELAKRRLRAREEKFRITNLDPAHPIFSNFEIKSPSGMTYRAEVRDVASRQFSCTCTDFRINGLGTCKHVEAILLQLSHRQRAEFKAAERISSPRADIVSDATGRLRVERNTSKLPPKLRARFDASGVQLEDLSPEELVEELDACRSRSLRVSQDVQPWLETRSLQQDRILSRRAIRSQIYGDPDVPFFTIANYEQIVQDSLDINARLRPDIVILDEAQRIKNWSTKTAQAVKRLESRYAFVLTGTPIENRIDELRSIVDFLDPCILGPLFRFNREYYQLDDRGRLEGYKNLGLLRERVRPILLRRRKAEVETELPDRTDKNHFVALTPAMRDEYNELQKQVAELINKSKRRPLTPKEQDLLMILLNMMRMVCDSPGIMKGNPSRDCPKLDELARVLDECLADPDVKVIIFSEWIGMLERVREWADKTRTGFAWHTGTVPQKQRRAEILAFRQNPDCRLFLSTDSGGVGLNLQNASVVINCDLPWNPAKLEQRIARAWRKNQLRTVTVVNLIAENTIEHGMLGSLSQKMELAQGVLDGTGDLAKIKLKSGGQAFLKRLAQVMSAVPADGTTAKPPPSDPAAHFASRAKALLGNRLVHCEETWVPGSQTPVLMAVLQDSAAADRPRINELFAETPWRGDKPVLQILDAATWQALENLVAAGMITIHTALESRNDDSALAALRKKVTAFTSRFPLP